MTLTCCQSRRMCVHTRFSSALDHLLVPRFCAGPIAWPAIPTQAGTPACGHHDAYSESNGIGPVDGPRLAASAAGAVVMDEPAQDFHHGLIDLWESSIPLAHDLDLPHKLNIPLATKNPSVQLQDTVVAVM